jgi:hypothetical protein
MWTTVGAMGIHVRHDKLSKVNTASASKANHVDSLGVGIEHQKIACLGGEIVFWEFAAILTQGIFNTHCIDVRLRIVPS